MKSWKTTVGGIGMIASALSHLANNYKTTGTIDLSVEDLGLISGGCALLFAKDHNVTGTGASATTQKEEGK